MNPPSITITTAPELESPFPHGKGYLYFIGNLQIIAGILSIVLSLFVMLQAYSMHSTLLLGPIEIYQTFGGLQSGQFAKLIATSLSMQMMFGWVLGLMMISAGICCLRNKGRAWVTFVTAANLLNFPHGTTVALITIHGLTRPGIRGAFRS